MACGLIGPIDGLLEVQSDVDIGEAKTVVLGDGSDLTEAGDAVTNTFAFSGLVGWFPFTCAQRECWPGSVLICVVVGVAKLAGFAPPCECVP